MNRSRAPPRTLLRAAQLQGCSQLWHKRSPSCQRCAMLSTMLSAMTSQVWPPSWSEWPHMDHRLCPSQRPSAAASATGRRQHRGQQAQLLAERPDAMSPTASAALALAAATNTTTPTRSLTTARGRRRCRSPLLSRHRRGRCTPFSGLSRMMGCRSSGWARRLMDQRPSRSTLGSSGDSIQRASEAAWSTCPASPTASRPPRTRASRSLSRSGTRSCRPPRKGRGRPPLGS